MALCAVDTKRRGWKLVLGSRIPPPYKEVKETLIRDSVELSKLGSVVCGEEIT
jgi:hypothetical protein